MCKCVLLISTFTTSSLPLHTSFEEHIFTDRTGTNRTATPALKCVPWLDTFAPFHQSPQTTCSTHHYASSAETTPVLFWFYIFPHHTLSHIPGTIYIKRAYPKSLHKKWENSQQKETNSTAQKSPVPERKYTSKPCLKVNLYALL